MKATGKSAPALPQAGQVEALAYALWVQEGRPHGRDREHWAEAERQLGVCGDSPATLVAAHPQPSDPHPAATRR
jgi:hypothetical protein